MINASEIKAHVQHILTDGVTLLRKEVELASAELSEKIEQARNGLMSLVTGVVVGLVALIFIGHAAIAYLSLTLAPETSALIVALFFTIVSIVLLLSARSNLKADELRPHRTIDAARNVAQEMKGEFRDQRS